MAAPAVYLYDLVLAHLRKIVLSKEPYKIGRGENCFLRTYGNDDTVSEEHAEIYYTDQSVVTLKVTGKNPVIKGVEGNFYQEIISPGCEETIGFGHILTFGEREYRFRLLDSKEGKRLLQSLDGKVRHMELPPEFIG